MDKVHDIAKKPWISKRLINLKEVILERESNFRDNNVALSQSDNHLDPELMNHLDKFIKSNEEEVKPYFLFNNDGDKTLVERTNCELKLFQIQLEHAKRMISDRAYKVNYLMSLRTTRRELLMRHLALINRPKADLISTSSSATTSHSNSLTAIVVVQTWPQPTKTTKVRLEKEILFRADQCLTDLRDQFKCQRDYGVPMDLSDNPEQPERVFRGELFKSGFFLIGNTFYNDMRDQNNSDLSESIIDWASKEITIIGENGDNIKANRGIGPFQRKKMEEHTFGDLEFRLGCPYLYLHQGECEHLFTISDIKYVPIDENLGQIKFPFVTATSIGRKADNLRCYMCRSRSPHWYTRNNNRLPVDPYFFCEDCFHSFNYDKDKKKIGQFQAYLYTSAFGIPDSVVMPVER